LKQQIRDKKMPTAKAITQKEHEADRINRSLAFSAKLNSFTASPVEKTKRRLSEILRGM